jgi:hypothetical protein
MSSTTPALLLVLLASPGLAESLTLVQLEALSKQGQSSEVLARGREVDPLTRTPAWNALLEKAALDEVRRIEGGEPETVLSAVDAWLDTYPHLEASRPLSERRAAIAIKAFDACLEWSEGAPCATRLLRQLKRGAPPVKSLVSLAARLPPRERAVRLALAAEVARQDPGSITCDATWLSDAIVDAMERSPDAGPEVSVLVTVCGPRLGKVTLTRVLEAEGNRRRFCPALVSQPTFEGVQRARCQRTMSERP